MEKLRDDYCSLNREERMICTGCGEELRRRRRDELMEGDGLLAREWPGGLLVESERVRCGGREGDRASWFGGGGDDCCGRAPAGERRRGALVSAGVWSRRRKWRGRMEAGSGRREGEEVGNEGRVRLARAREEETVEGRNGGEMAMRGEGAMMAWEKEVRLGSQGPPPLAEAAVRKKKNGKNPPLVCTWR
ncbi:hypothetical protein H0E87_001152 [Populus deltoides]|uniref:Uncharacterized protein n=1 Tax=Populus deltoides TaxID=3696 RepID=A0A8T2ZQH0_POPDE|nr:hypothetical protein H0E87_001152 [Populus deltoides]